MSMSTTSEVMLLDPEGNPCPRQFGRLIQEFEASHGGDSGEIDAVAWQTFFRQKAKFATVCSCCRDKKLQSELKQRREKVPKRVGFREIAEDVSSDEEEEEPEASRKLVIVPEMEKDVMRKWLYAARARTEDKTPQLMSTAMVLREDSENFDEVGPEDGVSEKRSSAEDAPESSEEEEEEKEN